MEQIILTSVSINSLVDSIAQQTAKLLAEGKEKEPSNTSEKDTLNDFIGRQEAKKLLGVKSDATLWRWENSGRIKRHTCGGKVFYKKTELIESITSKK